MNRPFFMVTFFLECINFQSCYLQMLKPSELILNADGSIYHLNLLPEDIATNVIFVGDPDRVPMVSKHFDSIEIKKNKREFCTHTGMIGKKRITVLSTGIGEDNIDIVLTELDALVNIDFKTRTLKKQLTTLNIVRVGTSGGLDAAIPLDSLLVSDYAVGFGGLMSYYDWRPSEKESALQAQCLERFSTLSTAGGVYVASGSNALSKRFEGVGFKGITLTCNGFYGPQRRYIRAPLVDQDVFAMAKHIAFESIGVTNMEMETAAIYGLSRLLGHNACSISVIVANRETQTFSKHPEQAVAAMIEAVLSRYIRYD